MRWIWIAALAVACSSNSSSGREPPPAAPVPAPTPHRAGPRPRVVIATPHGEVAVDVEVVSTEAKIERGLMYRENLPPDDGMLFLLGRVQDWTFWMHNTLIPLDMIFIKPDLTIAGIVHNAKPLTDTLRKVGVPSLYVLEVNGGYTAAHGVARGQKVRFEHVR